MDLKSALEGVSNTGRKIRNLSVSDWKVYKEVNGQSLFNCYAMNSQEWEVEPEYKMISPVELLKAWNSVYRNHFLVASANESSAFKHLLKELGYE